ncbi:MAG: F0F1 ATP synthase subunit delta [Endomicrobiales bacterium]
MNIDWFTFSAQIIIFLILVYLLKRFLYGRLRAAVQSGEIKLRERLAEVEGAKEEARREAGKYRDMRKDLEKQREQFLADRRKEAESRRQEMLEKARNEVEELRSRRYASFNRERDAFIRGLRDSAGREVFAVSRKVLKDLAGTELEVRIIRVFLENIKKEDDRKLKEMRRGSGVIAVRSSFPLPIDTQKKIIDGMEKYLNTGNGVQFEVSPELISGIEVRAGGKAINWNIDDYLNTLESRVRDSLQEQGAAAGPGKKVESAPAGIIS